MKAIEPEFKKNANQTGDQLFNQLDKATTHDGKTAYLYSRTYVDESQELKRLSGRVFGYETFVATVKKAGTYPLPGGKSITYEEDFEEYPSAGKFGVSADFFSNLKSAKQKFNELIIVQSTSEHSPTKSSDDGIKTRGRKKVPRPVLKYPSIEFSVKDVATNNNVEYSIASIVIKEAVADGTLKYMRSLQRGGRGKATNLYKTT